MALPGWIATESLIQMGGERGQLDGQIPVYRQPAYLQNLGEGTYNHSGYMAIRQAQAAGTNITYKILFNDAVAMTGGQPVDGVITVPAIASQMRSEGSKHRGHQRRAGKIHGQSLFGPPGHLPPPRQAGCGAARAARYSGVTVLIYDQTCAAEKRRMRKRGTYPDPAKRMFINEAVCEGCGDCSVQSNCLSIYPLDTELVASARSTSRPATRISPA